MLLMIFIIFCIIALIVMGIAYKVTHERALLALILGAVVMITLVLLVLTLFPQIGDLLLDIVFKAPLADPVWSSTEVK